MNLSRAFCPFSNDYYDFWKFKNPICLSLDQLSPGSLVCEPYKHFPQLMALEAFKTSVITLPSSAPATALPELVLVPDYPGRPRIVLFVNFREKLRKQKLLVYIRRPRKLYEFWFLGDFFQWDYVLRDFVLGNFMTFVFRGFCLRGFCPGGLCPKGFLSWGFM